MEAGLDGLHLPCFLGHTDALHWAGIWTGYQRNKLFDVLTLSPMVQFFFGSVQAIKKSCLSSVVWDCKKSITVIYYVKAVMHSYTNVRLLQWCRLRRCFCLSCFYQEETLSRTLLLSVREIHLHEVKSDRKGGERGREKSKIWICVNNACKHAVQEEEDVNMVT